MPGTKNINIVYNVDTQSIQVAKVQVDQAKTATDQLTNSIKNLGDQGGSNTQKFANNIEGLKLQMQQLKAQIDLTNQSDTTTLNQRIALYKEMQSQLDKYNQGLKDTQTQTQNSAAAFSGLYSTVKAVITAGILKEIVSTNLEMAKLAGQVEGVKRAFDRLPNSITLLEDLRTATHGTLDDLTLMTNAVKASNFHIPLEEMGKLLEFVAIKAQQTGLDIDYLTNSLINGLARNSPRLLEHLGFSIAEIREETKKYGEVSTAVYHLINENLKTVGGYVDTSATLVDQFSTSWKNLKIVASQALSNTGLVGMMKDVTDGITLMFKSQKQIDDEFNKKYAVIAAKEFLTAQNQNVEAIDKEIDRIKQQMQVRGALKATIKEQYDALKPLNHEDDQMRQIMQDQYKALAQKNQISQQEITILQQKKKELANPPEKEQLGLIEAIDEQIKNLNEDLVKTTSRQQIIDIQVRIKQLESDKLDLLDPDRQAKAMQATTDKINQEIRTSMVSNSEEILKGVNKQADAFNKQLVTNSQKDFKQFIAGLKLEHKEAEQEEADHQARMQRLMRFAGAQLFTNARQIATELINLQVSRFDTEIQNLQDYYSNQEALAGTNQKAVTRFQEEEKKKEAQLQIEKKKAQKRANIEKIEIDTAANVIRSILENGGIPYGLPFGAIAAAMGLVQVALVNSYAKGVIDLKGPGSDTSDSIPSMLSRGESVMTAEETRNSGNILRSIRAKKLNDQVLEKLTITTEGIVANLDDRRIVSAIERNKTPDYARQFSVLYETKETRRNMKRIIRSKSFNN